MEIGSVYEINPNCIERINTQKTDGLCLNEVIKYGRKNTVYTASAREAIALVLHSIEKETPDICKKCLMPAYMCDTVFIPFARYGWELCFYHIGKNMKADQIELENLLKSEKPSLLFLHAYYGMDTWKELRPLLKKYQQQGLLLMEDVTQSYYLEADTQADYVIGSLRKWYAVPDGGFVVTNSALDQEVMEADESMAVERLDMQIKKWNYLREIQDTSLEATKKKQLQNDKEEYLACNRILEERLDQFGKITEMSYISQNLLNYVDETECKNRRNNNYRMLQHGFQNKRMAAPVFPESDLGAAPLYFPIYADNREELQSFFCKQDIYAPVLWPVGKDNAEVLSKDEKYIFSHLLAIPLDHRYGEREMRKIIAVLDEYERSVKKQ